MTKKELMQLYYLNREIIKSTEELVELKIKARDKLSGDLNPRYEKKILAYEGDIVRKIRKCTKMRDKINRFISTIEDSLTRQIFHYRFVRCMSWKQVAYMTGGYNSEDGVRKIVERYLKRAGGDEKNNF